MAMLFMAFLLLLAALLAIGNNHLQTSSFEVESARLPASFEGYCIVQVSDLHGHHFGANHSRLLEAIRRAKPDLIAVTGDLTRAGMWRPAYVDGLARELRDIAPAYYVTGNHDHYAGDLSRLLQVLECEGVLPLSGTSVAISRGSESIVVAGIDDPRSYGRDEETREADGRWVSALGRLRASIGRENYSVLLSHRPEALAEYERLGFDLVLSGHAHGGQVRLPLLGPLYAPDQGWLPPLAAGVHRRGATTLVVSRGLGNSTMPLRVLNRPELVVVRLRRVRA